MMDDGFTPGSCCEMDNCACESCVRGGARDTCTAWLEHYYWNHMSDDKKQFLVLASGDFRHSLHIRQEIGGHLRNMITNHLKLESPNGHEYPVEVTRIVDAIVLRSGWNKFVDAHHIEKDDSILFVYRGNSRFKVNVFNSTGHEKSWSCPPLPSGTSEPVPPFAPSNHNVQNEQVVPNPGHLNSTNSRCIMFPGCSLSKAQGKKVEEEEIAHATRSEIPLYVTTMSKSNVSLKNCYVCIPLRLVDSFREDITKDTVELQGPFRIVIVGANKHSHDQIVLESGWTKFVSSNHIEENDLLIFRRMKKPSQLEVRIFDTDGCEKTSEYFEKRDPSSAQEISDDSVEIVDPPPPVIIDLTSFDDDGIVRKGTRLSGRCAKAQKMASTSSPCTKSGPSQQRYMLPKRTDLSLQALKVVEEKVEAIQSQHPIFVSVMTNINVKCTVGKPCVMPFSAEYASACLPDTKQVLVLEMDGKEFNAMLAVLSSKVRRIDTSWKKFAMGNALEVGDICLFQLTERNTAGLKMTVHLIRKSELKL